MATDVLRPNGPDIHISTPDADYIAAAADDDGDKTQWQQRPDLAAGPRRG